MKRLIAVLLAVLLAAYLPAPGVGRAEKAEYVPEENTGADAEAYPYIIRTPSAVWHLSGADAELLGEDAYREGLYAILEYAEADFADARAALAAYLPEEIPPVDIYTDFCNTGKTMEAGAYYDEDRNLIMLFDGWNMACTALLHEYVHYLTIRLAKPEIQYHFWIEGIADYISVYVCRNRLARSVNFGLNFWMMPPQMREQAWDSEDDCLDPRLFYLGEASLTTHGGITGTRYFAVQNRWIVRTERIQENPRPDELTFYEGAGMIAYLVETYGEDTVFSHWYINPDRMEAVYGKTFPELYREWAAWNEAQCRQAGISVL